MKPAEVKKLLEKAIARERVYIANMKASGQKENPQVVRTILEATARTDALEAVLDALNNKPFDLRLLAGEI